MRESVIERSEANSKKAERKEDGLKSKKKKIMSTVAIRSNSSLVGKRQAWGPNAQQQEGRRKGGERGGGV